MRVLLVTAAVYHVLVGFLIATQPQQFFQFVGISQSIHLHVWQMIGIVIVIVGLVFALSSFKPLQHWQMLMLGLVLKGVGALLFVREFLDGSIPWSRCWMLVIHELIWILPLAVIFWASIRWQFSTPFLHAKPLELSEATKIYHLSSGESIEQASKEKPIALVFLRHFGCTFTRKILMGLQTLEAEAEQNNVRLALVHMLRDPDAKAYLKKDAIATVSDPNCELYRAFGLGKGTFIELFGPKTWLRGLFAIFQGCGVGLPVGDGMQMPGVFLLHDGEVIARQKARSASDMPELSQLLIPLANKNPAN